ncbi:NitT/TauT family transport system substrate-binding protein [Paenibacillus algorifonticola]|uniref:NitT/TauT family transport system substrate-binding protein n=1 Tax=Paenibacillus algorifonticola TaxID=684063 RepID=A0A1I2GGC0_9BACL|nr:ABC transporter substrate-binding protein [Paenibacillus algorifonticola]SFF16874.1 NitT/TauT family transport system substrate-binding protein [Paenibacillus algorifonticola]
MVTLRHQISRLLMAGTLAVSMIIAGCSSSEKEPQASSSATNATAAAETTPAAEAQEQATETPAQEAQAVTLLTPKAPSLIPALLAADKPTDTIELKIETWDTIEQLLARIQNGDAAFIAAPLNVGSNLYAKGLPVQLIQVNTWGSMYLISTDTEKQTLADLAGETVYIPGQGGPPDTLTRYLVSEAGLDSDIELAYSTIPDMMQQLAAGTIKHAVLPEPVLSGLRMKLAGKLSEVVDYDAAWQKAFGESLPQTGIFVNSEWAKTNKEAIAAFQSQYKAALEESIQPGADLTAAAEAFGMPEAVLTQAMGKIMLAFKTAAEARQETDHYFDILLKMAPESVGGKLPDDGFYYAP